MLQDLYANGQQMASGIQDLLETALTEGRAVATSPAPDGDAGPTEAEGKEEELSVESLSNAALLASSVLATHSTAEVMPLHLLLFSPSSVWC